MQHLNTRGRHPESLHHHDHRLPLILMDNVQKLTLVVKFIDRILQARVETGNGGQWDHCEAAVCVSLLTNTIKVCLSMYKM